MAILHTLHRFGVLNFKTTSDGHNCRGKGQEWVLYYASLETQDPLPNDGIIHLHEDLDDRIQTLTETAMPSCELLAHDIAQKVLSIVRERASTTDPIFATKITVQVIAPNCTDKTMPIWKPTAYAPPISEAMKFTQAYSSCEIKPGDYPVYGTGNIRYSYI